MRRFIIWFLSRFGTNLYQKSFPHKPPALPLPEGGGPIVPSPSPIAVAPAAGVIRALKSLARPAKVKKRFITPIDPARAICPRCGGAFNVKADHGKSRKFRDMDGVISSFRILCPECDRENAKQLIDSLLR